MTSQSKHHHVTPIPADDEALTSLGNPTGQLAVGQWYWVLDDEDSSKHWLGCLMHIGSNFVEIEGPMGDSSWQHSCRIHFDDISTELRLENEPIKVIRENAAHYQNLAQGYLDEVRDLTARLGITSQPALGAGVQTGAALAVMSAQVDIQKYRNALILAKDEIRAKVFTSSLADIFDNEVPIEWFLDLLELVDATPDLDWLFLTKRIGNATKRLTEALQATQSDHMRSFIERWLAGTPPANVWLGATVVNQPEADRDIQKLQRTPAVVRFLSLEPLLGAVLLPGLDGIHWVIVGGESGPKARPMHPTWVKSLRDQCNAAGVKFFFKQWGTWVNAKEAGLDLDLCYEKCRIRQIRCCSRACPQ